MIRKSVALLPVLMIRLNVAAHPELIKHQRVQWTQRVRRAKGARLELCGRDDFFGAVGRVFKRLGSRLRKFPETAGNSSYTLLSLFLCLSRIQIPILSYRIGLTRQRVRSLGDELDEEEGQAGRAESVVVVGLRWQRRR